MYQINMEEYKCILCKSNELETIQKGVRDNKNIDVLECLDCGLVYLSDFSHIDKDFYQESNMHAEGFDINVYLKESYNDDKRRFDRLSSLIKNKNILDFGCGAGGFLRLSKNISKSVTGIELDDQVRRFVLESGLECHKELAELGNKKFEMITLFHVLEHIAEPEVFLNEIKEYLMPDGYLIIEVPNADDALITFYNSNSFKKFTYWSCHLVLYNSYTLSQMLKRVSLNNHNIQQVQRYPLSNHLYWLNKDLPGGHEKYGILNDYNLNKEYENTLAKIGKCDTIIAIVNNDLT